MPTRGHGASGSGKSTLAEALAAHIEGAKVVPMDGFHLDNDVLAPRDILYRKGAPETLDVAAIAAKVRELRGADDVSYPTFDRARDRVVPQGGAAWSLRSAPFRWKGTICCLTQAHGAA